MPLTDEQRRHIRLALAGLIEEAPDDADAAALLRRAFVLATLLAGLRDVTEPRAV